jgi:hypothetical protein
MKYLPGATLSVVGTRRQVSVTGFSLPENPVTRDRAAPPGNDEWIGRASDEGWIALTKDTSIVRDHEEALANSTLRVFALNNANLTGPEMAERYRKHLQRIVQRAQKTGPFVDVVTADGLERRWPRR